MPQALGRTRDLAASGTGYSGKSLDKVDKIRDAAERGVVRVGKTEMPVPDEVKAAALESLAEVKQTPIASRGTGAGVVGASTGGKAPAVRGLFGLPPSVAVAICPAFPDRYRVDKLWPIGHNFLLYRRTPHLRFGFKCWQNTCSTPVWTTVGAH